MYDRILFPTDGSDGSKRAERIALDLAEQFDSDLYVLHVVDTTHFSEPALSSMELQPTRPRTWPGNCSGRSPRAASSGT